MNTRTLAFNAHLHLPFQFLLGLLDALLIVSLALVPFVWLVHPLLLHWGPMRLHIAWGLKPISAPFVILAVRLAVARLGASMGMSPRGFLATRGYKRLILLFVSTYLFVGFIETALSAIGFKAELPPIIFVGKDSNGGIVKSDTLPDAKLLFKYEPGSMFDGRRINQMGFRDREVEPVKKPGAMRVICMGDSVSAQGRPGYSQYLNERMTNQPPTPQPWEAFNMAMHGYTSLQGLTLFRMRGKALAPDIVVICYGWNDQWLSPKTDRQQMGIEMKPWAGCLFDLLREKLIFQYMIWTLNPVCHLARLESHKLCSTGHLASTNAAPDIFHGFVFRVSPEEYHDTLTTFIGEVRAAGAIPLLMTEASRRLPQKWVEDRQYRTIEEGNRLHDLYMNIMRNVAREQYCDLLDLAAILAGKDCDRYFAEDGVHFDFYSYEESMRHDPPDQPGLRRIAEELDKKIRDIVRRPKWHTVQPQQAPSLPTLHANLKTASGMPR